MTLELPIAAFAAAAVRELRTQNTEQRTLVRSSIAKMRA